MIKLVVLVRRADGVTHEQLVEYWQDTHIPIVIRNVRPDQYRVTFFDAVDDAPYDGMAALWFQDAERARRLAAGEDPGAVADAGFAALTRAPHVLLACDEYIVVDGPRPEGAHKVTGLVRRKPGVVPETFYASWLEDHAPNVARGLQATPGGLRYVVSLATQGGPDPPFAGIAEVYYTEADASRAHMGQLGPDGFLKYAKPAGFLNGHEIVGIE